MTEIERIIADNIKGGRYVDPKQLAKAIEQWHKDKLSKLRITDIDSISMEEHEQYVLKARIEENKRYTEPFNEHDSPEDVAFWRIAELRKGLDDRP